MLKRNIESSLQEAIKTTPILVISGSRQVGKSTLVQSLFKTTHQYVTLDDPTVLASIEKNPRSFLASLKCPTIIDEVQRVPELFLPLKKMVHENQRPGFFILTSSANLLTLPKLKLSEPLLGLTKIYTLWPLSQGEILGRKENFIEAIFNKEKLIPFNKSISLENLTERVIKGGYPVAIGREASNNRKAWFKDYLTAFLEKDIHWLSPHIKGISQMVALLNDLPSRINGLLNTIQISNALQLENTRLKRYLALLQTTFILNYLPSWSKNLPEKSGLSLRKSPKVYLNDTGFLTDILFSNEEKSLFQKIFNYIVKNFVVMEILKQQTWSKIHFKTYHYEISRGKEIDILLEAIDGRVIGIEIKTTEEIDDNDFKRLRLLEKSVGNFHRGLILYMGDKTLTFDKNKYAIPLPALWEL